MENFFKVADGLDWMMRDIFFSVSLCPKNVLTGQNPSVRFKEHDVV